MTETKPVGCRDIVTEIIFDLLDSIFFTLLIIGGSCFLYWLIPMPNPDGNSQFTTMFSENIGRITLMLAPFLLLISMGVYLIVPNDENNLYYFHLNQRLQSLVLALRGLIIAVVGFMSFEILMVDNTPIKISALLMGAATLVIYPFIQALEVNLRNENKGKIGLGILIFVALIFVSIFIFFRFFHK
ncbi:hypothetical protein [Vibrio vulnificus]|uniref:hypothetical protein n=1 Tax=Vibrio vulnificus TaxID=672 RepID=UPI000DAC5E68|nr:hypothetical protein [Vibrio vulnificus]MDK2622647.1 hypothetical protein [Vibrio vulnificus]RAH18113.1 hypothetical protein DOT36_20605 [Vibrio vulnificus]